MKAIKKLLLLSFLAVASFANAQIKSVVASVTYADGVTKQFQVPLTYLTATQLSQLAETIAKPPITTGGPVQVPQKFTFDLSQAYELNTPVGTALQQLFDGNTQKQINPGYGKAIKPSPTALNNYWLDVLPYTQNGLTITKVVLYQYAGAGSTPWLLNLYYKGKIVQTLTYKGDKTTTYSLEGVLVDQLNIVTDNSVWPSQMEVWGTWTPKDIIRQPKKPIAFNAGINGFEWDWSKGNNPDVTDPALTKAMTAFTAFRHYLDWAKIQPSENVWYWDSTTSGGWNYDALYTTAKANGIEPLVCLQAIPQWLFNKFYPGETPYVGERTPCPLSADKSLPASYAQIAELCFQFSARFGRTVVATNLLKANTDPIGGWPGARLRTKKTALDLVKVIEPQNEVSKWWKGPESYQNGYQAAAMLSACYDGDQGRLGPGYGMRTADPTMKMSIPGSASADADWFLGIIDWSIQHRGYKADGTPDLPFDIMQFHWYSGSDQSGGKVGCPELSGAANVITPLVNLALQYNVELWWGETGFDLQNGSPIVAPAIGTKSAAAVQADWILRTALLAVRNGVNRTFFYNAYDLFPNNPVQFGTSGLLQVGTPTGRKLAGDALLNAKTILSGYTFNNQLSKIDNDVYVDCYSNGTKNIYVIFYGTQSGKTGNYTLNGKIVAISETPTFVQ